MARRRKHAHTTPEMTGDELMRRRARRQRRKGEWRKAAVTLRRLAGESGEARHWVQLGAALRRARREGPALDALKQGMYLHKRSGALQRARVVAQMILELDPADSGAYRMSLGA